jgi:hypothetical protein
MLSVLSDLLFRIRALRAGFFTELRTRRLQFVWVARTLAEASWLKDVLRQVSAQNNCDEGNEEAVCAFLRPLARPLSLLSAEMRFAHILSDCR